MSVTDTAYDIPSGHSPSEYKASPNVWSKFISIKPLRHHHRHRSENHNTGKLSTPCRQEGRQREVKSREAKPHPAAQAKVTLSSLCIQGSLRAAFWDEASQQNKGLNPIGCKEGQNLGCTDTQGQLGSTTNQLGGLGQLTNPQPLLGPGHRHRKLKGSLF